MFSPPSDNEHRCAHSTFFWKGRFIFQPKPPRFLGSKAVNFPGWYSGIFIISRSNVPTTYFGVQHVSFREIFFPQPQPCSHYAPRVVIPSSSRGIWACPGWRNYNIGFSHINLRCPFCWSRIVKQLFYCCGGCFVCGRGVVWILFLWNFH